MDLRPLWIGGGTLLVLVVGLVVGGLWAVNRQRTAHLASMRGLVRRLLTAQDDAAADLARELHDDLVQQLTVAAWQARDEALRTELEGIAGQLRGLAQNLHPAAVDDHPLDQVLRRMTEELEAFAPPSVTLQVRGTLPTDLPVPVRRHLYRIAQQAAANARAYARATAITITLQVDAEWLLLTVTDDGVGFDPGQATGGGLGLRSMGERMAAIGGTLGVESAPGEGTTIRAAWPRGGAKNV